MHATNAIAGTIYICLTIIMFLLDLMVLVTLLSFNEYATVTYRIIKNMCVACMMQLVVFFVGALMTFHNGNFNTTLEKVLGALEQSAWILYMSLTLALAIDRMLTFVSFHLTSFVSYVLLAVSWLHGGVHFVLLLQPDFTVSYCYAEGECFLWDYDESPGSKKIDKITAYIILSIEFAALCCYLVVLYRLIKLQMKKAAGTSISCYVVEIRIFSVALVGFLYESALIIFLTWGRNMFDTSDVKDIVINITWILDAGFFSVITIAINTPVRRKLVSLIRPSKQIVTAVTSFPASQSRVENSVVSTLSE
uniref:G protein-coupled receptor n=1 Tax=Steinernema glaseri TaxID=37863 RepID=A0A1I8A3L3_9BILA